jgi:hypothetical protein
MTRGQQELAAVRNYCEQVMLAKERAEKNREKRGDPVRVVRRREPIRRRGTTTTAVVKERGEGAVRLRRVSAPPQTRTTALGMRH